MDEEFLQRRIDERLQQAESIPSHYKDLAKDIENSVTEKLPREVSHIKPHLSIHITTSATQYDEFKGTDGEAFYDANQIHVFLTVDDLINASKVSHERGTQSDAAKIEFSKSAKQYVDLATKFLEKHKLQGKDARAIQQRIAILDSEEAEHGGYLMFTTNAVEKELRQQYTEEVLLPSLLENTAVVDAVNERAQAIYSHEVGHFIFNDSVSEIDITDEEAQLIGVGKAKAMEDPAFSEEFEKLIEYTGKGLTEEDERNWVNWNHRLINTISQTLPDNLREKYKRFVITKGLNEFVARSFISRLTDQVDVFHGRLELGSYAADPGLYLPGTNSVIRDMSRDFEKMDDNASVRGYIRANLDALVQN
jgi:hypothetical protein